MTKFYSDYFWKEGKPYGLMASDSPKDISYKIVADPYYKRISIEEYSGENFIKSIYDSALFDFRHLQPLHQTAWQKTTVEENEGFIKCHIRNQDDRLILIEEYTFENNLCRFCKAYSPQGVLISVQNILYTNLQDSFNGVILYDANSHPIMFKRYHWDDENREFSDLLEECWNMKNGVKTRGSNNGVRPDIVTF